ncbi:Tex family protein [Aquipseudomonas alcaligenes]|uniref:RNA-binding transcriptional accessory protein n=1 Tax=Aquipseudomonas alcaligenes TaxID=43263 RepID=A0AA37CIS4_AQUAC|nr:Tex family protein [Pseudomonas alcaligenes]BCR22845.1 RNA-binding transcriptional accessory protein [Pseudomonas alcaligenes]GIZ67366.1 RNA-binding transcriptional accessory protein [Pseudomonas alcaligenes]GIZ71041.1 RNA-binding transcriptional accessory protein [Pseudomonas alcaligenes]GIZ75388.1 RNA-binding transcriptional accessory protein [Pseudomonas alcaligenes]GIZ80123.1 RNA-binding transcriptional accessory protein [Pseudomonas alcaligenes]
MDSINKRIAAELGVLPQQVAAAVALLDEGSTVPFIARYRKEVTGSLDDTQLRHLEERLRYLRELDERRAAILASIEEQGKLTPELTREINEADTKTRLEDLYLPYKQKRRTKGQIALEAGLGELADGLFNDPSLNPEAEAARFVDAEKGFADVKAVLEGAKYILMERFAEDASLLDKLRSFLKHEATLSARVVAGKEAEGAKFSDYFEHDEPLKNVPSHRALAIFRGRNEGILGASLKVGDEAPGTMHPCELMIAERFGIEQRGRAADKWLGEVVRWTWKVKLYTHLETDLLGELREKAEDEAITVFARNLHDLLLAAPAGPRATLALDPGLRTGCKVAVVDATGKVLETATVYPHAPRNDWDGTLAILAKLCAKHAVDLISIGNGTASRETDKLAADLIKKLPALKLTKVMVSEAGASVYSASELAAREFPDMDVSLRGAVSIARRLQDPLAELVKIDPKSIGVGQYQHDVSQLKLARSLDAVVEDCVNAVGVDVNTASAALLARISGLNSTLAQNIVQFRDANGAFKSRSELKKVPRLGEKTFEQAAGFLRVMNGDNPLDASAVHPETYPLVQRIAQDTGRDIRSLIGDSSFLRSLDPKRFTDETFGLPTVTDILKELDKPGRDPRPEFKTAEFQDGVESLKDLQPGMILEGVVTNVTNFGAFVDIGVHQDGLVHISALSEKFVKDPYEVVKAGDIVKVKVMEVDIPRNRVGLSMRMSDTPGQKTEGPRGGRHNRDGNQPRSERHSSQDKPAPANAAMASLFANAKQLRK